MRRWNTTGNGALLRLLFISAAVWPLTPGWAEAPIGRFAIGVWSPAGWSGADASSYDRFFTDTDAAHLADLGVNLLVQTPRIGWRDVRTRLEGDDDQEKATKGYTIMQDLEETIIDKFKTHGGLVVEQSAEGDLTLSNGETYNSRFPVGDRLIDFAGVEGPIDSDKLDKLRAQVNALSGKWGGATNEGGFYGYLIGHEKQPNWYSEGGLRGGIYASGTYANMVRVIQEIRRTDTTRAIVAVGNTSSIGDPNPTPARNSVQQQAYIDSYWTIQEQDVFRQKFFRPDTESGPANIFMNEQYVFECETNEEHEVQVKLDELIDTNGSLTRTRDMVQKARGENRKAEWYHIINVNHEYKGDHRCWTMPASAPQRKSWIRRPNKAELSVQAYMALARGATGIVYYSHTTNGLGVMTGYDDPNIEEDDVEPGDPSCVSELADTTLDPLSAMTDCISDFNFDWTNPEGGKTRWYFGLMRFSPNYERQRKKAAMYDTVKTINQKLKVIGDELYPEVTPGEYRRLTWDANYDKNGLSADTTLIDQVTGSTARLEFGQFHNDEADYVLVVNRATDTSQTLDLRFDVTQMESVAGGSGSYQIEDVSVSNGTSSTLVADASGNVTVTGQALAAGDARLYRIVRVDHPGTVSLSTRTREFNHLLSATLEDPDVPLTEQVWQWQRRDPGSDWVPIPGLPPILSRSKAYYRVAAQDYGRELRATVSYQDAYSRSGAPKSEASEATYPVREWWSGSADWFVLERERDSSEEGRVRFRVLVSLRDELEEGEPDPAVGEAFARGDVGFRACTGPLAARVCVEFSGADFDPGTGPGTGDFGSGSSGTRSSHPGDRMSSSLTFSVPVAGADTPLDTGKTYRFTAHLVGPEGQKSPESNEVTVLGLRAEARSGAVGLSWDTPADIEGITGWSYRYRQEDGTWDGDSWQPTGGGATATTVEVEGLTNGVSYEFQVRALLGAETGPESFVVSATPARPDTPGRMEWSTTQPRVGQELTPTLIDPDNPALAEARWRWRRLRWPRSDAGDSLSAPAPESRSGESKLVLNCIIQRTYYGAGPGTPSVSSTRRDGPWGCRRR